VPKAVTHESGKLTGVTFEKVAAKRDAKGRRQLVPTGEPDVHFPCDDVLGRDRPGKTRFHGSSATSASSSTNGECRSSTRSRWPATRPGVFFGGDAAFGPKNIIWAVAHGHDAAISIDKHCSGEDMTKRPPPHVNLASQKMGIHEWSYDNAITPDKRHKVPLKDKVVALANIKVEVELGFDLKVAYAETAAVPQLRRADGLQR
jgi:hypothetical protein